MNFQPKLLSCSRSLRIPEEVAAVLADRNVGVHAAAVDADDRLGQEARRHAELRCHLAADQLVELNLVGCQDDVAVAVVDLELRRRDLGMVFFVFEPHRALHFGHRVDEVAQRIARKRVVVAAGVDVLERGRFVEAPFGVEPLEEESLDFVGGVERVAFFRVTLVRELLERAADVAAERLAVAVQDVAEDQHFTRRRKCPRAPNRRRSSRAASADRSRAAA